MKITTLLIAGGIAYAGYSLCKSGVRIPGLGAPIETDIMEAMFGNYKLIRELRKQKALSRGVDKAAISQQIRALRATLPTPEYGAAINSWGGGG